MDIAEAQALKLELNEVLACCLRHMTDDSIEGLVLFGSRTNGDWDIYSDVDALLIVREGARRNFTESLKLFTLDVHGYSRHEIEQSLDVSRWRNNIPLVALAKGKILLDRTGKLAELQVAAKELWIKGTGSLAQPEAGLIRDTLAGIAKAALKLRSRAEGLNKEDARLGLLSAQVHALYSSTLTLYQRSLSMWVYPPWVIGQFQEPAYEKMHLLNLAALKGNEVSAMVGQILWFCEDVVARFDALNAEHPAD